MACFEVLWSIPVPGLIMNGARLSVYYPLLIYTLIKFRGEISQSNMILLLSWAINGIFETSIFLLRYDITGHNIEVPDFFYILIWVIEDVNFLFFLSIVFGLFGAMVIYLDPNNDSEEKIKSKLAKLQGTKTSYLIFMIIVSALEYCGDSIINLNFTNTTWYAYVNLVFHYAAFLIRFYAHMYLFSLAIKMQSLFRKFGHVTGYTAERLMVICYVFYTGHLIYWYLLRPTLILLLNTRGFECNNTDILALIICGYWQVIAYPLMAQICFVALIK